MNQRRVLLINPTITSRRSARFPLAVLNLSASLDGKYESKIIDGNLDRDFVASALHTIGAEAIDAVGLSVMGGPQLVTAIAASKAIRERYPALPIVWGGHFPTICATAALAVPYVDYVIRGQGETTFRELLDALFSSVSTNAVSAAATATTVTAAATIATTSTVATDTTADATAASSATALASIAGLSWLSNGHVTHNRNRAFSPAGQSRILPYERLGDPRQYLGRTYLGERTAAYQAALGCRFRCTFCGVAAMFRGKTALPPAARLDEDLEFLKNRLGADSVQFFDHNFFDREVDTAPLLEVLAKHELPWWCFARSDALVNLSERSWSLVRKSRLRMAYIGAESASDQQLHDMRKGTRSNQTLEVVELCRRQGVIPELSFMLAPPQDPEGETQRTFEFIRHIKKIHPKTEIMIYIYAPLPPSPLDPNVAVLRTVNELRDFDGSPLVFPTTAEEWAQPQWVRYWCHTDVPWLSPRLRARIRDFTTVLGCRFPTITDIRSPSWGKFMLKTLATPRYRQQRYDRPWELNASKRIIKLWDPRVSSL